MSLNSKTYSLLRYIAIAGNIILVLWILSNGINEGFRGIPLEIMSYIGLMILLILNSILIDSRPQKI